MFLNLNLSDVLMIIVMLIILIELFIILPYKIDKRNQRQLLSERPSADTWSRRILLMGIRTVHYPEDTIKEIIHGMTIVMVPCEEIMFNTGTMKKHEDDPRFDNLILLSYDIISDEAAKGTLLMKMDIDDIFVNDYNKHYYTRGLFYYDRFTKTSYHIGTFIPYDQNKCMPLSLKAYFGEL